MNVAFTAKAGQPLRCSVCAEVVADTWRAKTAHWTLHQDIPETPTTAEEPTS